MALKRSALKRQSMPTEVLGKKANAESQPGFALTSVQLKYLIKI